MLQIQMPLGSIQTGQGFSPDNKPHIGRSGSIGAKDHKEATMLSTSPRESRGTFRNFKLFWCIDDCSFHFRSKCWTSKTEKKYWYITVQQSQCIFESTIRQLATNEFRFSYSHKFNTVSSKIFSFKSLNDRKFYFLLTYCVSGQLPSLKSTTCT